MDITDPCSEVWICPCGSPRSEPGLCPQCEMEVCEPVDMRLIIWWLLIFLIELGIGIIGGVFLVFHSSWALGIGLIGAVVLMFLAAWLAHFMFTGGSK